MKYTRRNSPQLAVENLGLQQKDKLNTLTQNGYSIYPYRSHSPDPSIFPLLSSVPREPLRNEYANKLRALLQPSKPFEPPRASSPWITESEKCIVDQQNRIRTLNGQGGQGRSRTSGGYNLRPGIRGGLWAAVQQTEREQQIERAQQEERNADGIEAQNPHYNNENDSWQSNVHSDLGACGPGSRAVELSSEAGVPNSGQSTPTKRGRDKNGEDSARKKGVKVCCSSSDNDGSKGDGNVQVSVKADDSQAVYSAPCVRYTQWMEHLMNGLDCSLGNTARALSSSVVPTKHAVKYIDNSSNISVYGTQYDASGSLLVVSYQGQRIRVYNVNNDYKLQKNIECRCAQWTVTDTAVSPNARFLLYSSLHSLVHMVDVGGIDGNSNNVESISNITDIHEQFQFFDQFQCSLYSIQWPQNSNNILAGSGRRGRNQGGVVVYDLDAKQTIRVIGGHHDDVNSVQYMDMSGQTCVSGGDDCDIKLWDLRVGQGSEQNLRRLQPAQSYFTGHTQGVTHMHVADDGNYFISNSKDQSIKLWDVRKFHTVQTYHDQISDQYTSQAPIWDYRFQEYPLRGRYIRHDYDVSDYTFYGHSIKNTLIRSYFSPTLTTSQRYIYTGSACGSVYVYDILTGKPAHVCAFHDQLVRDCSWHPTLCEFATGSWDGTVVLHKPSDPTNGESIVKGSQQEHSSYYDDFPFW